MFEFKEGPWGGGNQFLKALKNEFIKIGVYEEIPEKADVILFNSHHNLKKVISLKQEFPSKIFVHRVDGPIFLIRNRDLHIDKTLFEINHKVADATIFQSNWSKLKCYSLALKRNNFETIIMNAPDPSIFNRKGKIPLGENRKIRLIATSWSSNWNKGFDVYKWLDENLDFSKYEMTFIGNSPIKFKNIKWIRPLPSEELAKQLKQHDIFITASRKDPCSNSLIEALHCGLPAIAYNDGGHPEIIGAGGELFNKPEEIPNLIEKIILNYDYYLSSINLPTLDEVGEQYYKFMNNIYEKVKDKEYTPKKFSYYDYLKIKLIIYYWKFSGVIFSIKNKL
jgi:glycosyltransferase involved in cell wall biosynthesis